MVDLAGARARRGIALVLAALLAAAPAAAADRTALLTAGFLSKFPLFIQWPPAAEGGAFCLLGARELAPVLEEVLAHRGRDAPAPGPRVVAGPEDLEPCRVVYLGAAGRLPELLERLGKRPVLVVTRDPGAAARGAHINLYREGARMGFEVNVDALERSGLKASFRLLELARVVP